MSFSLAHSDGTKQSSLIPGACFELPLFAISSPKAINTRTDSSATLKHAVGFATASGDPELLLSRSIGVLLMSMFYYTNWWSIIRLSHVKCWCCSMHMSIISYIYIKAFCFWCSMLYSSLFVDVLLEVSTLQLGFSSRAGWNIRNGTHIQMVICWSTLTISPCT